MIDLYFWKTPNGHKFAIMLEELGIDYKVLPIDIGKGEQFSPNFLRISPHNKISAIVDRGDPGCCPESDRTVKHGPIAAKTGLSDSSCQISALTVLRPLISKLTILSKPLLQPAVQSSVAYLPKGVVVVSSGFASRQISANR